MTTTNKTTAAHFHGANEHVARPGKLYNCHWCGATNRAHTLCGCASSRIAHNERPPATINIDAIELTF